MPSREQLETALVNADKAGDYNAARELAMALKGGQFDAPIEQPVEPTAEQITPFGAVPAGYKGPIPGTPIGGVLEPALTIASSIPADIIAGFSGLAALPQGPEVAAQTVGDVREKLTYAPRSEAGKRAMKAIPEVVAPVGKTVKAVTTGLSEMEPTSTAGMALKVGADIGKIVANAGKIAYDVTESPAVAAVAEALPAAVMEAIGFGVGRRVAKTTTGFAKLPKRMRPAKISEKAVTKALLESAPEVKQIKNASRAVYKEIDNLKIAVKPTAMKAMLRKVINRAKFENVDDVLTPKSARVVNQFMDELNTPGRRTLTDLDQMRKRAQIAARSPDPSDARVGAIMIDEIDDFLDKMTSKSFTGPDVKTIGNVSERYKAARSLWGRARRAELIKEAFEKADLQASGFENGIRVQLRQILNNKKRARYFTKDELSAMTDVVKGSGTQNTLKLIGRLGFSEGSATNILGGLVGMGVLGPAAPVAGQISRKLAQVTTKSAANKIDSLIRSGAKGREIARAYLQSVPKAKRTVSDLSDMLLASGSEIDDLLAHSNRMVKEAAEIARARKTFGAMEAAGAAAPAAISAQQER